MENVITLGGLSVELHKVVVVSRHHGAILWIAKQLGFEGAGILDDRIVGQIDGSPVQLPLFTGSVTPDDLQGKTAVGNLPLHLAALAAGVVVVEFPSAPPRGFEYTAEDMDVAGARLRAYRVEAVG